MFRIENNVLIGEEVPIRKECTNVGALVLEKMRSRPGFVAQVSRYSQFPREGYRRIDFNVNFVMIRHLTLACEPVCVGRGGYRHRDHFRRNDGEKREMRAVAERASCSAGRHNRHLHSQSLGVIRTAAGSILRRRH